MSAIGKTGHGGEDRVSVAIDPLRHLVQRKGM
jgi:hypothetical protein